MSPQRQVFEFILFHGPFDGETRTVRMPQRPESAVFGPLDSETVRYPLAIYELRPGAGGEPNYYFVRYQ
jgi:hypothetical protein